MCNIQIVLTGKPRVEAPELLSESGVAASTPLDITPAAILG